MHYIARHFVFCNNTFHTLLWAVHCNKVHSFALHIVNSTSAVQLKQHSAVCNITMLLCHIEVFCIVVHYFDALHIYYYIAFYLVHYIGFNISVHVDWHHNAHTFHWHLCTAMYFLHSTTIYFSALQCTQSIVNVIKVYKCVLHTLLSIAHCTAIADISHYRHCRR